MSIYINEKRVEMEEVLQEIFNRLGVVDKICRSPDYAAMEEVFLLLRKTQPQLFDGSWCQRIVPKIR